MVAMSPPHVMKGSCMAPLSRTGTTPCLMTFESGGESMYFVAAAWTGTAAGPGNEQSNRH